MKRMPRPEPSAGETARLGEQLRDARLALGLSLEDMSADLRIRRVYLAALEEGDPERVGAATELHLRNGFRAILTKLAGRADPDPFDIDAD